MPQDFGPGALNEAPSMNAMINLGSFSKYAGKVQKFADQESMLQSLKEERLRAVAERDAYTKKVHPKHTDIPVSQSSVLIFGDSAWHSQPKKAYGAQSTFSPSPASPDWVRRKWGIDHNLASFIPAHVTTQRLEFQSHFRKAA